MLSYLRRPYTVVGNDLSRSLYAEITSKYRKPLKHKAGTLGKKLETPVECSIKRLMTGWRCAMTLCEELKAVVQARGDAMYAECIDASGCKFDGQREPIESSAYLGNDRCIGIG